MSQEMDRDEPLATRRDWEIYTYIVYTYRHGVLGAYRTREGAEIAARVLSETAPYINLDIKVSAVDLNEYIDVTVGIKPWCWFVCGERRV